MFVLLVLGSTTYVASIFVRWANRTLFESYHNDDEVEVVLGENPQQGNPQSHTYAVLYNVDAPSSHSLSLLLVLSVPGSLNCNVTFAGLCIGVV